MCSKHVPGWFTHCVLDFFAKKHVQTVFEFWFSKMFNMCHVVAPYGPKSEVFLFWALVPDVCPGLTYLLLRISVSPPTPRRMNYLPGDSLSA